ncbi:hypothetical protein [Cloacibacillus porcorum]
MACPDSGSSLRQAGEYGECWALVLSECYRPAEITTALVLPELWNTGYALDIVPKLADRNAAETTELLGRLAKKYGYGLCAVLCPKDAIKMKGEVPLYLGDFN